MIFNRMQNYGKPRKFQAAGFGMSYPVQGGGGGSDVTQNVNQSSELINIPFKMHPEWGVYYGDDPQNAFLPDKGYSITAENLGYNVPDVPTSNIPTGNYMENLLKSEDYPYGASENPFVNEVINKEIIKEENPGLSDVDATHITRGRERTGNTGEGTNIKDELSAYKDYQTQGKQNLSKIGHGVLDVIGMGPGLFGAADALNAVWYLNKAKKAEKEGNSDLAKKYKTYAGISTVAMAIPGAPAGALKGTYKTIKGKIKKIFKRTPPVTESKIVDKFGNPYGKSNIPTGGKPGGKIPWSSPGQPPIWPKEGWGVTKPIKALDRLWRRVEPIRWGRKALFGKETNPVWDKMLRMYYMWKGTAKEGLEVAKDPKGWWNENFHQINPNVNTDIISNVNTDTIPFAPNLDSVNTVPDTLFNFGVTHDGLPYRNKKMGGTRLQGGMMSPIPGSNAVEFSGNTHDQGGIMLDKNTEVEDGETMDKVTMRGGGPQDYFFSSYLKHGGMPFSMLHKNVIQQGGDQQDINMLAKMQEHTAGRNPMQVAKLGGVKKYEEGGPLMSSYPIQEYPNLIETITRDKKIIEGKAYSLDNGQIVVWDGNKNYNFNILTKRIINGKEKYGPTNKQTYLGDINKLLASDSPPPGGGEDDGDKVSSSKYKIVSGHQPSREFATDVNIPKMQNQVTIDGKIFYLNDPGLQQYITEMGVDKFGEEWIKNVDPKILTEANITSFNDLQDPIKIGAFQNVWNKYNPDNQLKPDSLLGEAVLSAGYKAPKVDGGDTDDDDEGGDTDDTDDTDISTTGMDPLTTAAGFAQLLPALSAMRDQPDYMKEPGLIAPGATVPERQAKIHLDRIDLNQARARTAADIRGINRFIETSGGGPANIMNKMQAFAAKRKALSQIDAAESQANVTISNEEAAKNAAIAQANITNALDASKSNIAAALEADRLNLASKMHVEEWNRAADAATKDAKRAGLQAAAQGIAGINRDRLAYLAQERYAQAISGETGSYQRNLLEQNNKFLRLFYGLGSGDEEG